MSFDSYLEVVLIDGEPPPLELLKPHILMQLDEDGMSHDVYEGIFDAFTQSRGNIATHCFYLRNLCDALAQLFPHIPFDARGLGEEFRDTWIAEYRDGQRVFSRGPWEYGEL